MVIKHWFKMDFDGVRIVLEVEICMVGDELFVFFTVEGFDKLQDGFTLLRGELPEDGD